MYCIVLYCTPVHAWPVGKKHSATQLCVTPFANGRTGLGFSRTKNVLAFFSHNGRKMLALNIDDLQTYTCRASTAPLLRLIWPSRPHSGRRSWDRQRCRLWRQLLSMLPRKLCAQQGVRFVPLVAESTGAWDREVGHILLQISRSAAARTEEDAGVPHGDLLQELCVLMRSHRARAVLRRRAELTG